MTKKTEALVVATPQDDFPILAGGEDKVRKIIASLQTNLGGERLSQFDLDQIKVPAMGDVYWTIPDLDDPDGIKSKDLRGVIVGQTMTRSYWAVGMDEGGGGTPPDCSSKDCVEGRGTPGGECGQCPLAEWGSDKNQRGQACKVKRNIFILIPGQALPLVLNVPASSLSECKKFGLRLASKGLEFNDVILSMTLSATQNADGVAYSEIVFSVDSNLPTDMIEAVGIYAEMFGPILR